LGLAGLLALSRCLKKQGFLKNEISPVYFLIEMSKYRGSIFLIHAVKKYTQEEPSNLPTFIVFLSDGGVTNEQRIKKAVVDAAKSPIFWQLVGLAGSSYGILERLDTITNRLVDNANFNLPCV